MNKLYWEAAFHLQELRQWNEVSEFLTDIEFIEGACAAGMIGDLVADYDRLGVGRNQSGPPIRTAWRYQRKYGLLCPYCAGWSEISETQLKQTIACPACDEKLKVNRSGRRCTCWTVSTS
jgi:hypothetical protein